ncbi:MAG: HEAT repeat domain-containing protein, partial [bacterium]
EPDGNCYPSSMARSQPPIWKRYPKLGVLLLVLLVFAGIWRAVTWWRPNLTASANSCAPGQSIEFTFTAHGWRNTTLDIPEGRKYAEVLFVLGPLSGSVYPLVTKLPMYWEDQASGWTASWTCHDATGLHYGQVYHKKKELMVYFDVAGSVQSSSQKTAIPPTDFKSYEPLRFKAATDGGDIINHRREWTPHHVKTGKDLLESLRTGDQDAKLVAVREFCQTGYSPKEAIPDLISAMTKESNDIRKYVPCALEKIGPAARKAIPTLIRVAKDENEDLEVRKATCVGLAVLGLDGIRFLIDVVKTEGHPLQKNAAMNLDVIYFQAILPPPMKDEMKAILTTYSQSHPGVVRF